LSAAILGDSLDAAVAVLGNAGGRALALPLGDLSRNERIPFVTLGLGAANAAMWLAYQVPAGIRHSADTIGLRSCGIDGSCTGSGLPWPVEVVTSMFGHGSWSHIVGNMVFLLAFGPLVESRFGRVRHLGTYLAAGPAAAALQAGVTLAFASHDAAIPSIGASGVISGVIAAYVVARPFQRVLVWVMPLLFIRVQALALLGIWFLLQALEGSLAPTSSQASDVAFFGHVGGFLAGLAAATAFLPDAWTRHHWHPGGGRPAAV
jgi:membrane associated rhomboid family serine protease